MNSLLSYFRYLYRLFLPIQLRTAFRDFYKTFLYALRYLKLRFVLLNKSNVNLILGAALTSQEGWYSTNENWLDISKTEHWQRIFSGRPRVSHAVAEHVFEHLSVSEMRKALRLIYQHLCNGGSLRIAVPDGNHPDETYRKHTGINGIGADASDHKQFISYEFLKKELEDVGFTCELKEGYTSEGQLIRSNISRNYGLIMRTRDSINYKTEKLGWDFIDSNTSLIVDALK
ncbi:MULTISPECIES: hypothetical protein [Prochlorococcus]|uniref:Protein distantly related to SAM-dependent methyltransferases n=2 Tax=Prochlorococcus TaxID=1218 RepID=Q7VAY6_PROMA|nr:MULTISPECIES: hypothetical protein [Prochlorococcus]AAQ00361.1 Protein distantly related to SAM-dependent methyltransferases [Prochlorococcus marinus subsp. marinus str. CCMP1375]